MVPFSRLASLTSLAIAGMAAGCDAPSRGLNAPVSTPPIPPQESPLVYCSGRRSLTPIQYEFDHLIGFRNLSAITTDRMFRIDFTEGSDGRLTLDSSFLLPTVLRPTSRSLPVSDPTTRKKCSEVSRQLHDQLVQGFYATLERIIAAPQSADYYVLTLVANEEASLVPPPHWQSVPESKTYQRWKRSQGGVEKTQEEQLPGHEKKVSPEEEIRSAKYMRGTFYIAIVPSTPAVPAKPFPQYVISGQFDKEAKISSIQITYQRDEAEKANPVFSSEETQRNSASLESLAIAEHFLRLTYLIRHHLELLAPKPHRDPNAERILR